MRWKTPSDSVQLIIMAPILVPILLASIPVILPMLGAFWVWAKLFPRREWHTWFAWHPVKLWFDERDWVWLQSVERQGRPFDHIYRIFPAAVGHSAASDPRPANQAHQVGTDDRAENNHAG